MSPLHNLPEETLILLLKKKNQQAFSYLYDNYSEALYGVVCRIVASSEHAEEVIQDVFVKIWKHVDLFDAEKGRLYTWMISIARNTALDYRKSKAVLNEQKNQPLSNIVNSKEEQDQTQIEQSAKADFIGFRNILDKLKPEWRILIEMAYYEGYTQQEIAEQLDVPLGTVKTRTRAAFLQLQQLLKEYR
ncbi:ECF RNA polymerase sigma factor RpoE [compost metagenome]|uniref:RNA polymerase sigma-70 factor (ECF subfamily) n=1 Tax=Sphingobacterium detergens TaxID=1145106 RepID=A0A420BKU4_SPHD1|nr:MULTISPECIES: sigma-70 family RNA polymerase sigma factor [Sphingobacterium]MCS4227064.1 RNA polymerase sigma-70 factor (ECF subfamily) [Sphingobacterium sp. BIGb0165]RKE57343.1 RNA polymerase sigma-70 factor (ECF subfamily) [Sphingobacterium detergens]